jgi:hypothetical protein
MAVAVHETGQQGPPGEIKALRSLPVVSGNLYQIPDGKNPPVFDRYGLRTWARVIDREDRAAGVDRVGDFLRSDTAGQQAAGGDEDDSQAVAGH